MARAWPGGPDFGMVWPGFRSPSQRHYTKNVTCYFWNDPCHPPPRKDAKYSEALLSTFIQYKDLYRQQITRELRGVIMKEKILPAAFNFWKKPGEPRMTEDESKKRQKVFLFILNLIMLYKQLINIQGTGSLDTKQLASDSYCTRDNNYNDKVEPARPRLGIASGCR